MMAIISIDAEIVEKVLPLLFVASASTLDTMKDMIGFSRSLFMEAVAIAGIVPLGRPQETVPNTLVITSFQIQSYLASSHAQRFQIQPYLASNHAQLFFLSN